MAFPIAISVVIVSLAPCILEVVVVTIVSAVVSLIHAQAPSLYTSRKYT